MTTSRWWEGIDPSFAWKINTLLWVAGNAGVPLRVTSGFRSREEQERLYQRWLSGQSPFPAAKPGTSAHERGKAVDVVWVSTGLVEPWEGAWEQLGAFGEQYLGLRWGGRFRRPDPIHFEVGLGGGS